MPRLERMRAEHAAAVLAFERDNRAFFAAAISDRGDEFFDDFDARHRDLLAEQETGSGAFYVVLDETGRTVGRCNLYDIVDRTARVGYRVAERVAGRGVATAALLALCDEARAAGLLTLIADTSRENVASQKVLTKAGFDRVGAASPSDLGGKQGIRFRRELY